MIAARNAGFSADIRCSEVCGVLTQAINIALFSASQRGAVFRKKKKKELVLLKTEQVFKHQNEICSTGWPLRLSLVLTVPNVRSVLRSAGESCQRIGASRHIAAGHTLDLRCPAKTR